MFCNNMTSGCILRLLTEIACCLPNIDLILHTLNRPSVPFNHRLSTYRMLIMYGMALCMVYMNMIAFNQALFM